MVELFLDTSQSHILACLYQKPSSFVEMIKPHHNQLGAHLSLSIQELLNSQNLTFQDLIHIKVGAGPGSYTGTRVGIALAQGLGFGLNIPVTKLPSLLFYRSKGSSTVALKSNFNTCGYLSVSQNSWEYKLVSLEELEGTNTPIIDPKNLPLNPDWPFLAQNLPTLTTPLYFQLK
jgi:tRNA threonylcarbamoyl adenosine modification protein YeaZ